MQAMKAQEAYNILDKVPVKQFMTSDFTNSIDQCCSMGHLARLTSANSASFSEDNCRPSDGGPIDLLDTAIHDIIGISITVINDNMIRLYIEDNPKNRVLHLLKDAIALGL